MSAALDVRECADEWRQGGADARRGAKTPRKQWVCAPFLCGSRGLVRTNAEFLSREPAGLKPDPFAWLGGVLVTLLSVIFCLISGPSLAGERVLLVGADGGRVDLRPLVTFLRDPTRQMSAKDLIGHVAEFSPLPEVPGEEAVNFGYDSAAIWLRIILQRDPRYDPRAPSGPWLLGVGYPGLDRVSLHWQDARGVWLNLETGDHVPLSQRPLKHRNLLLPIELEAGAPQVFFLRVQSEGNLTIPLTLWSERALAEGDRVSYTWHAFYFGALLALLVYNLMLYFAVGERAYLAYVLMVLGMGLGQAALTGFGALWLWPEAVVLGDRMLPLSFALCGFAGAIFTRQFLDLNRLHPASDRLVLGSAALFASQLLLGFWMPYSPLAMIVSASGLGFAVLAVVLAVRCLILGQPAARLFLVGWLMLLIGVGVMSLRNFGLLPTTWLTTHLMQIGSLAEMLLLAMAFADRINTLRAQRDAANAASVEADRRLLSTLRDWGSALEGQVSERTQELSIANERLQQSEAQERRLREEQQHFIAMIAHEIRTPLAVIKAATQSLRELDGDQLPERLKRHDRIDRAIYRVGVLLDVALAQDRTSMSEWALDVAEIDLETLTYDLCGLIPAGEESRLKITVLRPLPKVQGDMKMLRVVGINLLENALKYSDPLSPVEVRLQKQIREGVVGVTWTFEDQGPGIPRGLEEKIFEKYFRAISGCGKPGLGIGLFLARFICERHGGHLGLSVLQAEKGASFEVWLPLRHVDSGGGLAQTRDSAVKT